MSAPGPVDPIAWEVGAEAVPNGVRITLAVPARGVAAAIVVDRAEARAFARAILAAAGDATERTYPHPQIKEA